MLVLRRKIGEVFFVGEDVAIEVLDIEGKQVKIGIRAPRKTVVLRQEILSTIQANREAVCTHIPSHLDRFLRKFQRNNSSDSPSPLR